MAWIRSNGDGRAALLDVTEDGAAHVEQTAALVIEQRLDEPRRVQLVGALTADDEAEPLAEREARAQCLEIVPAGAPA